MLHIVTKFILWYYIKRDMNRLSVPQIITNPQVKEVIIIGFIVDIFMDIAKAKITELLETYPVLCWSIILLVMMSYIISKLLQQKKHSNANKSAFCGDDYTLYKFIH